MRGPRPLRRWLRRHPARLFCPGSMPGQNFQGLGDTGNPRKRRPPARLRGAPPLASFPGAGAPGVGSGGRTGQSVARPGPLGPPAGTSRPVGRAARPPCPRPIGVPSPPSLGRPQPLCFRLRAAPFGRAGPATALEVRPTPPGGGPPPSQYTTLARVKAGGRPRAAKGAALALAWRWSPVRGAVRRRSRKRSLLAYTAKYPGAALDVAGLRGGPHLK